MILSFWLDIATAGLCDDAKERVTKEITAHYTDAMEHAKERGLTGLDAEESVIAALGDPKKARREFKRVYLTGIQFRAIEDLKSRHKGVLWPVLYCMVNSFVRLPFMAEKAGYNPLWAFLGLVVFYLVLIAVWHLSAREARQQRFKTAIVLNLITFFLLFLSLFACLMPVAPRFAFAILVFGLVVVAILSCFNASIWRKLNKAAASGSSLSFAQNRPKNGESFWTWWR